MSLRRCLVWGIAAVLVVLAGRALAYAAVPSPAAHVYGQALGGPGFPTIALTALVLGSGLAVAICWLAALGVRERRMLERRVLASPPPLLRPGRVLANAALLWTVTASSGGLLEAYVHWRGGLGWHGLDCVVGPVHRDLLPIAGALCLIAAAAIAAAEHVLAWMRRTFALLVPGPPARPAAPAIWSPLELLLPREHLRAAGRGARAPPARA
jgi:hypothetical protein